MNLDADKARELLDYNPETGKLYWKPRPLDSFKTVRAGKIWNGRYAGTQAGCADEDGYLQIRVNGRTYKAHRIAWLIHCGRWPKGRLRRINRDKLDNRICNLGKQDKNLVGIKA